MGERITWRCGGEGCGMLVKFNDGGELPFGWYLVPSTDGDKAAICPDCLTLHPDVATMLATEKAAHVALLKASA